MVRTSTTPSALSSFAPQGQLYDADIDDALAAERLYRRRGRLEPQVTISSLLRWTSCAYAGKVQYYP